MSEPLLHEIRAAKPLAPSALRERVRALSAQEPAREPFLARLGLFCWHHHHLVHRQERTHELVDQGGGRLQLELRKERPPPALQVA